MPSGDSWISNEKTTASVYNWPKDGQTQARCISGPEKSNGREEDFVDFIPKGVLFQKVTQLRHFEVMDVAYRRVPPTGESFPNLVRESVD